MSETDVWRTGDDYERWSDVAIEIMHAPTTTLEA